MYVGLNVRLHLCLYLIRVYECMSVSVYACMHACMYVCIYACVHAYVFLCTYVCLYCMYLCMFFKLLLMHVSTYAYTSACLRLFHWILS